MCQEWCGDLQIHWPCGTHSPTHRMTLLSAQESRCELQLSSSRQHVTGEMAKVIATSPNTSEIVISDIDLC